MKDKEYYDLKALAISKEIEVSALDERLPFKILSKTRSEAIVEIGKKQYCFVYAFGSVVFFNTEEREQLEILAKLRCNGKTLAKFKSDDYSVLVDPRCKESVEIDEVRLKRLNIDKLAIVSEVLAQSVSLETLEDSVNEKLSIIERINIQLKMKRRLRIKDRSILGIIGDNNSVLQRILTKLYVLESPELIWDGKDLKSIFYGMKKMFEMDKRFDTLKFKVDFMQRNMELLMDLRGTKRDHMLELTIIALIALEILLFVYELWL